MKRDKNFDEILKRIAEAYRETFGGRLKAVLLYGSYARGTEREGSDLDIVGIVDGERELLQREIRQVWDLADELGLAHDVLISPTVLPLHEFELCRESVPYYENIAREGVRLYA